MKYSELNEQKQHGTDGFPIEFYYVDEHHPQYEMPLHWHREFELVLVKSGELLLYLNGMEYHLKQGDIGIVNSGVLHRGVPFGCVYECIVCDLNMLSRCCDTAAESTVPLANGDTVANSLLHSDGSRLYSNACMLFGAMRQPCERYELSVLSCLFGFVFELFKADAVNPRTDPKKGVHAKLMAELVEWLEDNLSESVTLSRLALMAGLNEKYFCRVFKQSTGKTPIEYINQLRINNACRLLTHGKRSVTEAALLSGFADMSYFSKVFKKYKHCSPRQWCKNQKNASLN